MGKSIVSTNRKAYHEFQIIEILEAGLELLGSEVKSLREGKASLKESYIKIRKGQAWMVGVHGLAKGKKLYDKRDTKKRRDIERDIQREMKKTL